MSKQRKPKRRRRRPDGAGQLQLNDLPELRHARSLWKKNRLLESLAIFEKAARLHSHNAMAIVDASRALGAFYRIQEAERLLDRLVELANGRADVLQLAGQSYRLIRRPEMAIECFRSALSANDSAADSHLELALLLERRNQLELAHEHIDARLKLLPADGEARMLKGRLLRRAGKTAQSETILRNVGNDSGVYWMTRARAWAELALLLDAQGAYDDAWKAMLTGKLVAIPQSRSAHEHRQKVVPRLNKLVEELGRETTSKWRNRESSNDQRVALLTGLPRSGTTLLEVMLNAHSKIVSCDEFDAFSGYIFPALLAQIAIHRFDANWLEQQTDAQLDKLGNMYVRFMGEALGEPTNGAWLLDKNPSLLLLIPAYFRLLPALRLLVALRDPRDLLVSCMMTYFPLNDFSVDFLRLHSGAERIASDLTVWLKLREVLPANWAEVRYEKLVTETQPTIEAALATLGLSWEEPVVDHPLAGQINSPSYEQIGRPVYSSAIGRWENYSRQIQPALKIIDPMVAALNY